MEIPGGPLVLPPVDSMWGMQPSAPPPTIEPPDKTKWWGQYFGGEVGLQQTLPPKSLEGWYNTIPPQMIEDGLIDNRTAYYVRCLGGPHPCPYTVPPAILKYWMPVSQVALGQAEASTSLDANVEPGAVTLPVTAMMGFQIGREILIDAGTISQEINYIAGFGSLVLKFPLRYKHTKGILITMPRMPATTPAPMTFQPWQNFQPFVPFNLFNPGPAPAPAPAPMPYLAPAPFPGPAPAPRLTFPWLKLPMVVAPGPAPGPGGPGPAPAPVR